MTYYLHPLYFLFCAFHCLGMKEDKFCEASKEKSQADAIVIIIREDQTGEAEGFNKVSLLLHGQQEQLVLNTTEVARGTMISVVMPRGPMDILFSKNNLKICSILWVGYLGQDGGDALTDIICGQHNLGILTCLCLSWPFYTSIDSS